MKTLVISDVHQNIEYVNKCLEKCDNFDYCVFLGDFFDSFKTVPDVYAFRKTCKALKYLVLEHPHKDKFRFCVGNHDLKYIFENRKNGQSSTVLTPEYYCSGVTKSKISDFRKEFFDEGLKDGFFLDNFKLVYRIDGWTFSHAGVMLRHFPYGHTIDSFVDDIALDAWKNFRMFNHPHNYLISDVGIVRYGNADLGGLLWCDWRDEFSASIDVGKQVCGHTTVASADVTDRDGDSESWNIDVHQTCYGIIENGIFRPEYI